MGLDNPLHIAFLVVILLLVFGARRLPEIGRSLGGGMREFKDAISGEAKQSTLTPAVQQPQPPVAQPAVPVATPAPAATPAPVATQAPVTAPAAPAEQQD
jgi:sec-independent protein translocase protein TatA